MGADLVMLSAVAPLSLSPKYNILPGLVFGGQIKVDVPKVRERYYYPYPPCGGAGCVAG